MNRALFVWSKVNENIGYFQGLNDIAAIFYIIYFFSFFNNDMSEVSKKLDIIGKSQVLSVEADIFYSLCSLTDKLNVKKKISKKKKKKI